MRARGFHWLAAFLAICAAGNAAAVTDAERLQVYRDFRVLFDAKRYSDALPLATQLVTMTEEQYGKDDRALVNPLTNLGTVYYRMKNYPAAEREYERSIKILEATAGTMDRQYLRPLHGLGAAHFAEGEYLDASVALKRAIDLSRNLNGLFNEGQLAILDPLISSYIALDLNAEAEKEQQYALRVAESAYGKMDVRMLKPLGRYAHWLERIGRYTSARLLYARALTIAEQSGGQGSLLAVEPLLGIARSYRLEFVNGAEVTSDTRDPFLVSDFGPMTSDSNGRLNPDGERALRLALAAIDKGKPVNHRKRGEALIELGDWYMSAGSLNRGIDAYKEAWKDLSMADATDLLAAPRLLAYRPPSSSVARSRLSPDESEEQYVEVLFTVGPDGRTDDVRVADSNASESLQNSVISAVKRARYGPRFANGEPVATNDVKFRERLLVKAKNPAPPS